MRHGMDVLSSPEGITHQPMGLVPGSGAVGTVCPLGPSRSGGWGRMTDLDQSGHMQGLLALLLHQGQPDLVPGVRGNDRIGGSGRVGSGLKCGLG